MKARGKVLRSMTIVSDELYVDRKADRQIENVIKDMGRPGYVLVARQMGKTNLLLNAKRRMQDPRTVFGYIDLSNSTESLRACLRSIVDGIVESHRPIFGDLYSVITTSRLTTNQLPPHREHDIELRLILNSEIDKLVIILDEIDSLTLCSFSDQVFAQIRSVYFSRVNFPEYERLTYVLSGVAEPSELIKDKKLSPFNIGEKIYLDDFTLSEFTDFIIRAGLSEIGKDTIDRIFHWVQGNPRMTWDICSEIENTLIETGAVSVLDVDQTISRLYLQDFNRSPIDHIRTIVESDPSLRNALINIHHGKGNEVTDSVRSQLYLAGISRASDNSGGVHIKNRVIAAAISESWLQEISRRDKLIVSEAQALIENGKDLAKAAQLLEEYIASNPQVDTYIIGSLGDCYFKLGRYSQAITTYEKTSIDSVALPLIYYTQLNKIGFSYTQLGQYDNALKTFDVIENKCPIYDITLRARLNRISISILKSEGADYNSLAHELYEFIEELPEDDPKIDLVEFRAVSYFNLGRALRKIDKLDEAGTAYKLGIQKADAKRAPRLMLQLYSISQNKLERTEMLISCSKSIIEHDLLQGSRLLETELAINTIFVIDVLNELYINQHLEEFNQLANYLSTMAPGEYPNLPTIYLALTKLAMESEGQIDRAQQFSRLQCDLQLKLNDFGPILKSGMQLLISILEVPNKESNVIDAYFKRYLNLLVSREFGAPLDAQDMRIIGTRAIRLFNNKRFYEVHDLTSHMGRIKSDASIDLITDFLVFDYIEMLIKVQSKTPGAGIELARGILAYTSSPQFSMESAKFLTIKDIEVITNLAKHYAVHRNPVLPKITKNRSKTMFGRNEWVKVKYTDGREVRLKYKKVADDIDSGKCEVIKNDSKEW